MQVTVHHIGPTCVQCNQTKKMMDKLEIVYDQVDLRQHPEITAAFKEKGHLTAPIVVAGDQVWSGFKFDLIKALANRLHAEKAKD